MPALTPADIATLAKIPTLILWGDHVASEDPGTPFGEPGNRHLPRQTHQRILATFARGTLTVDGGAE